MKTSAVILLLIGSSSAISINPTISLATQQSHIEMFIAKELQAFNLVQNKKDKTDKEIQNEWKENLQMTKSKLDKKLEENAEAMNKAKDAEDNKWAAKYESMRS